jgi:hypothetical protein
MTGARMRWDLAAKRQRMAQDYSRPKEKIPIRCDDLFWQAWRDDRAAMRAAGYRVTKIGSRWHAWIEGDVGNSAPKSGAKRPTGGETKWGPVRVAADPRKAAPG